MTNLTFEQYAYWAETRYFSFPLEEHPSETLPTAFPDFAPESHEQADHHCPPTVRSVQNRHVITPSPKGSQ